MRIDDHNWVPTEWGPNKNCETIFNLCGNYFKGPAFVENMMVKKNEQRFYTDIWKEL